MIDLEIAPNLETYKELIKKFKSLDIVKKELTLFDVGTRGHFENPTTELLSFFLEPTKEHSLNDCFFKGLQDLLANKKISTGLGHLLYVETEVSTAKGNRIDLLLETNEAVITVECKIYHDQNNPFDDYTSYGKQRIKDNNKDDEQDKTLIQIVLCLDGKISNELKEVDLQGNRWYGVSYKELVEDIEPHLSKALLDNPYNKWGLFAREFLLHLKELNNVGEISKDELDFLTENVNDYFKLSEYLYKDIIPKIAAKIEIDLKNNLDEFSRRTKMDRWYRYEPYISFSNEKWGKSSSCVVFCIRNYKANEMTFTIHIDFFNKNDIGSDDIKNLLQGFPADFKNEADGSNIWRVMWKYNDFNIEKVSERIVKLMTILNDYEANKSELNH